MNRIIGIVMVAVALTLALVPFFTDCESQDRHLTLQDGRNVPMKCHWTGLAEIGVAVPLVLTGLRTMRRQRNDTYRSLAVFGAASGALAILFPTALIGVCANPMMICNMIMLPTLAAGGILTIVASVVLYVWAREPNTQMSGATA